MAELGNNWRPMITVARSPGSGVGRRHWPTPKAFVSGRHCGGHAAASSGARPAGHRPNWSGERGPASADLTPASRCPLAASPQFVRLRPPSPLLYIRPPCCRSPLHSIDDRSTCVASATRVRALPAACWPDPTRRRPPVRACFIIQPAAGCKRAPPRARGCGRRWR